MQLKQARVPWLFVLVCSMLFSLTADHAFAARVLIAISDGSPAAVVSALQANGHVVDVQQRCGQGPPPLSTMQAYDVVIAWTNCQPGDAVGWGNVLADYVDGGGRVILATFSWFGPSFDIEGRIITPGYSPLDWAGNSLYSWSNLGVYNPAHPLMTGITEMSAFYRDRVTLDPGATLVASWADGFPAVAVNAACNTVGVNAYPGFEWAGDLMKVFVNAVALFTSSGRCTGGPPVANAGPDQSGNEGQVVTLNGTVSSDPDNDPLTYQWTQISGTVVVLSNAGTANPSFTAPVVSVGGETLTFELTVIAGGESDTDTVNITVVNVNHAPVADAGSNQSIAEGSPVTLDGSASFDVDTDPITYAWVQVSGPTVTLSGPNTIKPTFAAPVLGSGGAPGVVATLVFKLTVNDGFPKDAPAPGFSFADVEDTVTVEITNTNNPPTANADVDQTVNENSAVTLNGSASADPDTDSLTFSWQQIAGTTVVLNGSDTAAPTLSTPFVNPGGGDLTFQLTVNDGYGGTTTDTVVIHVQNANDPPLVSAARPSIGCLWPPNHAFVQVAILGVTDPNSNATITIDGVSQDEPTEGLGDGDTPIDAVINSDGTVLLRAERSGTGDGRVYHIRFTASDLEGSASGRVTVCVPRNKEKNAVDGGALFDSTR